MDGDYVYFSCKSSEGQDTSAAGQISFHTGFAARAPLKVLERRLEVAERPAPRRLLLQKAFIAIHHLLQVRAIHKRSRRDTYVGTLSKSHL